MDLDFENIYPLMLEGKGYGAIAFYLAAATAGFAIACILIGIVIDNCCKFWKRAFLAAAFLMLSSFGGSAYCCFRCSASPSVYDVKELAPYVAGKQLLESDTVQRAADAIIRRIDAETEKH